MSEHDDPIDRAYSQAEAMLDDPDARAARRARILAAVAEETARAVPPPARPSAWRRGGWLAAASMAGVALLLATQPRPPAPFEQPAPAATRPAPSAPASVAAPAAPAAPQAPKARSRPQDAPAQDKPSATRDEASTPELRAAPAPAPPPARDQAPIAAGNEVAEEVVVTGNRIGGARQAETLAEAPERAADRLRDAASAGRTRAVAALVSRGVPIDAPDEAGETALMKAVQADHPEVVALLRRHGANAERRNHAGRSARDMAAALADPQLDRALGVAP